MQTERYPEVPDDFGHWLAGFLDGEGTFAITQTSKDGTWRMVCQVLLRRDDQPILEEIRTRTGLGRVRTRNHFTGLPGSKPQCIWVVARKDDVLRLVQILDAHPLRAKKARDYAIWREAVLYWNTLPHIHRNRRHDWGPIPGLQARLRAIRAYEPVDADEEPVSPRQMALLLP